MLTCLLIFDLSLCPQPEFFVPPFGSPVLLPNLSGSVPNGATGQHPAKLVPQVGGMGNEALDGRLVGDPRCKTGYLLNLALQLLRIVFPFHQSMTVETAFSSD